jgi:glycine/D-amino acid oxidase-like deaminating enzyme
VAARLILVRIVSVEAVPLAVSFRETFRFGTTDRTTSPNVVVVLRTDEGHVCATSTRDARERGTPSMNLPRTADVVVVGSGITGAATAAALAERGASVLVLDKEAGPAREGSGRAQGSLRVQGRHPAEFPLALEALRLWSRAAAEDPEHDAELSGRGNLYLATRPEEPALLRTLTEQAHASGLDQVEYLDAAGVREVVPAATGHVLGGMWSPYDAQAQPELATELFVRRAERAGVGFAYRTKVTGIVARAGRVTGVETVAGTVETASVVVGAGVWTSHLVAPLGIRLPLMPVALSEVETAPLPELFRPTVRAFGFGARQRSDGRLVVSAGLGARVTRRASLYDLNGLRYWLPRATIFRKNLRVRIDLPRLLSEVRHRATLGTDLVPDTSPEPPCDRTSVDRALLRLAEVFPGAADAPGRSRRYWAGLVDMTPDGLPVLDHRAGPDGLVVVAGLCGHGLALGPVLGEIAADLTLDGSTARPIAPFTLARFDGEVATPEVMI